MKKKLFFLLIIANCFDAFSQTSSLTGIVKSENNGETISGAAVQVENTFNAAVTNRDGKFVLRNLKDGNCRLIISHISFEKQIVEASVPSSSEIVVIMKKKIYLSEEVTITATRATTHSAVAYTGVNKDELEKNNLGQDLPYLLNMTPSVVVTSDAGTGIGYSGIRIRGSDATRVNVTLNGVPVNDAEAHGVYWVDLPDLASSVDNIQIQRGVGTSTNGAGAFGGSVNIQTQKFSAEPYGSISSSFGSFNTWKNTVGFGTGLLNKKSDSSRTSFSFDGRVSKITSDGYIDRASSDLKSFYLSGGFFGSKSSLRFIVMSGKEKTYQAWYGVQEDSLGTNRTFNPAGIYYDAYGNINYYHNQTDNYQQDYYQLIYSKELRNHWDLNLTAHLTKGKGYYEEYKEANDLYGAGALSYYGLPDIIIGSDTIAYTNLVRRKWLDNDFYGLTWSVNKNAKRWQMTLGGALNQYAGDHFNEITWAQYLPPIILTTPYEYESSDALKTDMNIFGKIFYDASARLHLFGDLQLRAVGYRFPGFTDALEQRQQQAEVSFFNPKAGVTYDFNNRNSVYASVSFAGKEPVRDDYVNSTPSSRPKPEYMSDVEAGYKFKSNKTSAGINFYFMNYKDQLILTGQINDVGEYTRKNISESSRAGVEMEAAFIFSGKFNAAFNASFSSNKIKSHSEFVDNYDDGTQKETAYGKTDIAFSPSVVSCAVLNYSPVKNFSASLQSKYVGKQFLDNTADENKKLGSYFVNDLRLNRKVKTKLFKEFSLTLLVNNILDEVYESNGYTYGYISGGEIVSENFYYPQAGRIFLAGVSVKF
ncbi:MAG TPA: TonB-dependent receptor [Bacteroidia bacterium]|nr:TonB-dependent receptor [Bacteroidia bacterium]